MDNKGVNKPCSHGQEQSYSHTNTQQVEHPLEITPVNCISGNEAFRWSHNNSLQEHTNTVEKF